MRPALKLIETPYRIEKGIDIPHSIRGDILYPFADMLKGDSFLVPCGPTELQRLRNKLGKQIKLFAKRFGATYEFTSRTVDGGIRLWRVK